MFADIVQKTQNKTALRQQKRFFSKICNKKSLNFFLQILQKICIKAEEERKTDQFLLQKIGILFFGGTRREQCKSTRSQSAQQEQSRRRKRDHEELGYAVHVHTKQPQTIFYSTNPHLFFHFCPVILT